jgi:GH35 family endo-1,4-beta-xylanase
MGQVRSDFGTYWNQITAENEHKWASVEGSRDRMSWSGGDRTANYAKQNNIPWKFHTLVWGAQYPNWMTGLSTADQTAEITEWFDSAKAHYPEIPMIDVVNEGYMSDPNNFNAGKHAPIPFREALGGTGSTGFEWIVQSFKMARQRWPKAILIYNDYNTLEWSAEINWIKQIIPKLVAAGAPIDAVGFQAHGLKGTSSTTLKSRLDDIWNSIKLPMVISEYDISDEGDGQTQLTNYKNHIPIFWNHPKVIGITVWGYIDGSTWVKGTGLIKSGAERPAMTWLKEFIGQNLKPPNDYPDLIANGTGSIVPAQQKPAGSMQLRQLDSRVQVTFSGVDDARMQLRVHDLKGSLVHAVTINNAHTVQFATTGFPGGYYVVKATSGKRVLKAGFVIADK